MESDQTVAGGSSSVTGLVAASALLAGVVLWAAGRVQRTHRSRLQAREMPERLQTWEDEGGRPAEAGAVTPPTSP